MLTMLYKIKISIDIFFLSHIIGANVMLAASQIWLGSLLLVNYTVYSIFPNKITINCKFMVTWNCITLKCLIYLKIHFLF
jgi:hypothetical protein